MAAIGSTTGQNVQKLVLVTGATGKQGGAAARHLLGRGVRVRALTRDPNKPAGRLLARSGVEVVQGDLDDRASVERAVAGVDGVFSVQNFWETGYAREVKQGTMLADAAKMAGVKHFVYSSVGSAHRSTGIPHFDSKWEIEQYIRAAALPYTILRPVFFMQNWHSYVRDPILNGTLPQPLDPDRPLQQISVDDIGAFAAMALDDPSKWLEREMDLAGEELTMPRVAETLTRVLGREVRYTQVDWGDFRKTAGEEMYLMYRWFNDVGYGADIAACRREYPRMQTLEQVIRSHDWRPEQAGEAAGIAVPT